MFPCILSKPDLLLFLCYSSASRNRIGFHGRGHSGLLVKQTPGNGGPDQKAGTVVLGTSSVHYPQIAFLED